MSLLEHINSPDKLRSLAAPELEELCAELRDFIVENVSKTGGHLASNLGAVELTVALHRVYDSSRDRILFDVGHQCYAHKILTGRMDSFNSLRQLGGISGFPKPCESVHDAFVAGHASTSISTALGMARARTLMGEDYSVAAVIGDGALTGGVAYEALCDAGESGEPLVVILNDNEMSITRNVGGLARMLSRLRSKPRYFNFKRLYRRTLESTSAGKRLYKRLHRVKTNLKTLMYNCSFFEEMGFTYLGPVDGHDINQLCFLLQWARELNCPVLLHVLTTKGKGYAPAEQHPDIHHGVGSFDPAVGVKPEAANKRDFSAVFGETLTQLAASDPRVCAITAAMTSGTGLSDFADAYPDRFFDVGIAEEHAVAMAGGLAKQGMIPVPVIYSTFLQRAYDMLLQDIAMLGLHTVLGVDRGGLVGADGETHQGVFDISYLLSVPGLKLMCPSSFAELDSMLRRAVLEQRGPVAIRYPRGAEGAYTADNSAEPAVLLRSGDGPALISYGIMINEALEAAEKLASEGMNASVIKLNELTERSFARALELSAGSTCIVVIEDCISSGCAAEHISMLAGGGAKLRALNLGNGFIPHGSAEELMQRYAIDSDGICRFCKGGGAK